MNELSIDFTRVPRLVSFLYWDQTCITKQYNQSTTAGEDHNRTTKLPRLITNILGVVKLSPVPGLLTTNAQNATYVVCKF